jgi:hypothetical protein
MKKSTKKTVTTTFREFLRLWDLFFILFSLL